MIAARVRMALGKAEAWLKAVPRLLKAAVENKVLIGAVELLAGLSVIVTVVVMWAIYIGQRDESRALQHKELAIAMLTLGHNENLVTAKAKVTSFILAHHDEVHRASAASAGGRGVKIAIDAGARQDFVVLTEYYDEVLKCRESKECDPGMIDLWFRYDICGFTEFAELVAFPAMFDDFGTAFGDRLVRYRRQVCPKGPV